MTESGHVGAHPRLHSQSAPRRICLGGLLATSLRMPSWAAEACYRTMLTADMVADLANVPQPVLQIVGNKDPVHSVKGARWLTGNPFERQVGLTGRLRPLPYVRSSGRLRGSAFGILGRGGA